MASNLLIRIDTDGQHTQDLIEYFLKLIQSAGVKNFSVERIEHI